MAYNHAEAEKEFQKEWKQIYDECCEANMSEDSIAEIYKVFREAFLSDRRYAEHTTDFPDAIHATSFSEEDFSGRYDWVESLENPELARMVKRLKRIRKLISMIF